MFGFFPFSAAPFSDLGSTSVNIAVDVTGVSATGQIGAVTVIESTAVNLTGVSATGAVGTVAVTGSAVTDVTGLSATGAIGTVAVQASYWAFCHRGDW
jgi:hypothetical protein